DSPGGGPGGTKIRMDCPGICNRISAARSAGRFRDESMRTGLIALCGGLLCLRFLPALPPAAALVALAVVGVALLPTRGYPLALFLLGLGWACGSAQLALDDRLAAELDGRTLWLQGRI